VPITVKYHLSRIETVSKFGSILARLARMASSGNRGFTVFSGDCFSPSLEGSISLGAHMIPVLNSLGVDVACPGNHGKVLLLLYRRALVTFLDFTDFDYGEDRLKTLLEATQFPWTLCNYLKPGVSMDTSSIAKSENLLAGTHSYIVRERRGFRFGFFGIGGTDWPSLCQHLPSCQVESPISAARQVACHLRRVENCDVVIAITHMRLAEDLKVSQATTAHDDCRVDLLLGGHDHETVCRLAGDTCSDPTKIWQDTANEDIVKNGRVPAVTGNVRIIKSGSDFQSFSNITLFVERQPNGKAIVVTTSGTVCFQQICSGRKFD
jgi:2',3'-cyclic-nucleotide 2'-phosphodiesterase (5'-nucleotidase family)